ncbi:MAG: hypothetical protein COA91_03130 [Robiginitomaculum sp.]|nr:MAG: hypothetical protein COA91_03130 [Robiginitomaculum sp.]
MQAMVRVLDGADAQELRGAGLEYIEPKFAGVYRNNSVSAFVDVLQANYKTVYALVGPEYFSALALNYLEKFPARNRTLVGYGQDFYQMIEAQLQVHKLAYLASFAKLDRAWTLAHMAADTKSLSMAVLQEHAAAGGDLANYRLGLKPDVNLVSNDWPVLALWSGLRDDIEINSAVELVAKTEYVLVWRRELEVLYKDLSSGEFAFLSALQNKDTLGAATVKCLTNSPETDVGALLAGMMAAGIFMKQDGGAHA